jgi:hypothetical protein
MAASTRLGTTLVRFPACGIEARELALCRPPFSQRNTAMNVTQVLESADEVVTTVGPITIKSQCYLGKISAENTEYAAFVKAGRDIALEENSYLAEMGMIQNVDWLQDYLQSMVMQDNGELRLPNKKEMEKRSKELNASIVKARTEAAKRKIAALDNLCHRIVYLTKSWDLTEGEKDEPLPITAANIRKYLSETIIHQMFDNIESAVFGPLAPGRNFSMS